MALTKSQEHLKEMALRAPDETFNTEIVLCDALSGLSTVVRSMTKQTAKGTGPRVIGINASRGWDAVQMLSEITGTLAHGYAPRINKAIKALAGEGKRPLTILLEESHHMHPRDMERIATSIEWAANEYGVEVRLVYLLNRVMKWNSATQARELAWPRLPTRFLGENGAAGRVNSTNTFLFTRAGIDELRKREVPNDLREDVIDFRARKAS